MIHSTFGSIVNSSSRIRALIPTNAEKGSGAYLGGWYQLGRTHRYLWSDRVDELLADEQNPTGSGWNTLWALSDHQGTVKDLIDYNPATGVSSLANSRTYDAFGNLETQTGSATTPIGYTGKYFDQVTGLQNNWNRWYSAKQGRFISQDPIGFAGGDANLYRYGGNEATGAVDPTGLIHQVALVTSGAESGSTGNGDSVSQLPCPLAQPVAVTSER